MKRIRKIKVQGDIALVPLTKRKVAVIDAADVHLVAQKNWHASKCRNGFYARCNMTLPNGMKTVVSMHRVLMGFPPAEVDHEDKDGLNNRRSTNLRIATRSENMQNRAAQRNNTSGFKGVWFQKKSGRWYSAIRHAGQRTYFGPFDSAQDASDAYVDASKRLHGLFSGVSTKERNAA